MSQARIAVVTGASRGIGAGIAITLAAKGADVALVYTSESSTPQAQEVLQQITALGRRAILVRTDLSAADCGTVVRDAVLKGFQTDKIDILVNNAGVTSIQDTLSVDLDEYDRVMNINVRAPILLVKALSTHLNRGGRIINLSSILAREPYPGYDVYVASKAALEGLTRQWAVTLGVKYGVTVNAIGTGAVKTDIMKGVPEEVVQAVAQRPSAEKRLGTADDVAEVVAFLASEGGRWINGQVVGVDGGVIFN